ncbi:MAG: ISAs1 family transposase [Acidobacteria bacterium]|nr:ISAs1 family transposase [Acidobacteriota bacterium]
MLAARQGCDFQRFFGEVEDPRLDRRKAHGLMDILFLCVAGTLAGCEGPSDIADFARQKLSWCRQFVPLKNGPPSHDTIGRVIALLRPGQFQRAFLEWVASFSDTPSDAEEPRFVPIDGKTLRGSRGAKDRQNPLHLVSAWASAQGLTLGQVAVDDKSNEITAIPQLLEMLELKGAIVSIDAMGCQKEIAAQIVNEEGDYLLAVKDNQPHLAAALAEFFQERHEHGDFAAHGCRQHHTQEKSRGRLEERSYLVAPLPEALRHLQRDWKGLRSLGQVINLTTCGEKQTSEVRYYISSREPRVKEFATAVRRHWSIESMHWVLDVVFREDASRIRNGHGTENFGLLRKFALSLLKQDTSPGSLKGKRKRAAWNTDFLESIVFRPRF